MCKLPMLITVGLVLWLSTCCSSDQDGRVPKGLSHTVSACKDKHIRKFPERRQMQLSLLHCGLEHVTENAPEDGMGITFAAGMIALG